MSHPGVRPLEPDKDYAAVRPDTLTICDNAPNLDEPRSTAFKAKSGSGYDLITFKGDPPTDEQTVKKYIPPRIYPPGTTVGYSNYATSLAGYTNRQPNKFG